MKKDLLKKTFRMSAFTLALAYGFCTYSAETMRRPPHKTDIPVDVTKAGITSVEEKAKAAPEQKAPLTFTYKNVQVTGFIVDGITYYSTADIVDAFGFTYDTYSKNKFLDAITTNKEEVPLYYPYYLTKDGERYLPYRFLKDSLGIDFIEENGKCVAVLGKQGVKDHYKNQYMFHYNGTHPCTLFGDNGTIAVNEIQSGDMEQLYTICINDQVYLDGLAFNLSDRYAVIQIDDGLLIAISDLGVSDDYTTTLYLYKNEGLYNLGTVGGLVDGGMLYKEGITFENDGQFYSEERMRLLHTGWYKKPHKIDTAEEVLKDTPTENYSILGEVTLLRDFDFYTSKEKTKKVTCKAGTTFTLSTTDDEVWVSVRPKEDPTKEYWMTFTEASDYYMIDNGTAEGCEPIALFEGLFLAD